MAAGHEESSSLEQLMREAIGGSASDDDASSSGTSPASFFPILVGLMGPPPASDDDPEPPPDRIVLVNPVTQGMVVLQGDPAVVAGILSERLIGASQRKGQPPASKASIQALRTVEDIGSEEEEEEQECPVCLDDFDKGGLAAPEAEAKVMKEMPCGHRFHGECIEKWLGMHGSCPVCRYLMPAEEEREPKKRERVNEAEQQREEGEGEGEEEEAGEGEGGETRRRRSGRRGGVWVTIVYGRSRRNDADRQDEEQGDDANGVDEDR